MGRPKTFVEDEVLDLAIEVFRLNGYKGTSVEDLLAGMGISRSSFYEAFGDKHHLFLRAFDRYAQNRRDQLCAFLQQPGPRKPLIRKYFEDVIDDALRPPVTGCLLISSAVELAAQNPAVVGRLQTSFTLMEEQFLEALQEARETGELKADRDPRAIALFLVSSVRGLRLTARVTRQRNVLLEIVDVTLSILD
jgi:TetR/AcrR family transcriptional repressor of nem operon